MPAIPQILQADAFQRMIPVASITQYWLEYLDAIRPCKEGEINVLDAAGMVPEHNCGDIFAKPFLPVRIPRNLLLSLVNDRKPAAPEVVTIPDSPHGPSHISENGGERHPLPRKGGFAACSHSKSPPSISLSSDKPSAIWRFKSSSSARISLVDGYSFFSYTTWVYLLKLKS